MRGPLPIRTKLARFETPASYVSRLACENGLPGAHEFRVDQDLDMQGIADGNPWMLQKRAHLGGLSSDEIFPVGPGETVLGQVVDQRRVHNLTTFARVCRASTKRSRQALVAAGFWRSSTATSDDLVSQVFCAHAPQPVLDKLNGGITRRMAIKQLHIPREQFDALFSGRILQPMPWLGEITPYYARTDVMLLLEQLAQERCIDDLPTDLVDIQTACRKLVCGAAEIVDLIKRDQLEVIAQDKSAEGYLAVRLSVSELACKLAGVGVEGYTKAKLKQLLSINDPAVKFLIEAGYLKATASRNPVTRKAAAVVLPKDYALFLDRFIPAKHLAEMQSSTPRSVIDRMRKHGVAPLEMPDGPRRDRRYPHPRT